MHVGSLGPRCSKKVMNQQSEYKIFVGNLSYSLNEGDISGFFSQCGHVVNVALPLDRETQRARGFAFVTLGDQSTLNKCLELNGQVLGGRPIVVNVANSEKREGGRRG